MDGYAIREARKRKGLTQGQLADLLGVTTSAVSGWERGDSDPRWSRFSQLAAVLDLGDGPAPAAETAAERHERFRRDFGSRLKAARIAADFPTAKLFAFAMGLEEATYRAWERGDAEPSLDMLQRLCVALHVEPNDLLGFSRPMIR